MTKNPNIAGVLILNQSTLNRLIFVLYPPHYCRNNEPGLQLSLRRNEFFHKSTGQKWMDLFDIKLAEVYGRLSELF